MPVDPRSFSPSPVSRPTTWAIGSTPTSTSTTPATPTTTPSPTPIATPETPVGSLEDKVIAYTFTGTVAAGTNDYLFRPSTTTDMSLFVPWRGSIIATTITAAATKTAGNCTFYVRKNGTFASQPTVGWTLGSSHKESYYEKGRYPFAKGDSLTVSYQSTADFAPTGKQVEFTVYMLLNMSESS